VKNTTTGASNEYIEQIRQKIGTEFSDRKAEGKKRNELGKDDFIKLMSAQLKHQDPISPLKNEEMAAQLAQFSSLEQMVNMNTNIEKLAAAQKPQDNVLAASLIGKKITTDSAKFALTKGASPELKFDLPDDASAVSVAVADAKGEVIREYELGSMTKGPQSLRWDGKNGKNQPAAAGEYSYRVTANDTDGKSIQINTSTAGLVSGVSFEAGKAMLIVDGKKIPLEAVNRIDADLPTANSLAAAKSDTKQKLSSTKSDERAENSTQGAKKVLPTDDGTEKIKNMLGSLGPAAMTGAEPAASPEGMIPEQGAYPFWNPSNL
jgi:flagellar basal-body rod modification protein FlgD